jgi:UrcA family protein
MKTPTHFGLRALPRHAGRAAASVAVCLIAATAVLVAPQAHGAPLAGSAKASLAGLDLSTPEGQNEAKKRLHQAARLACSRSEDHLDLGHQPHFVACVDRTLSAALQQLARFEEAATRAGRISAKN